MGWLQTVMRRFRDNFLNHSKFAERLSYRAQHIDHIIFTARVNFFGGRVVLTPSAVSIVPENDAKVPSTLPWKMQHLDAPDLLSISLAPQQTLYKMLQYSGRRSDNASTKEISLHCISSSLHLVSP